LLEKTVYAGSGGEVNFKLSFPQTLPANMHPGEAESSLGMQSGRAEVCLSAFGRGVLRVLIMIMFFA
jgi:hypothetical protein